jgi:hypothetical protein
VVALGDFRDAVFACKTCSVKLTCQGVSRFAGKIWPVAGHKTIIWCGRTLVSCG